MYHGLKLLGMDVFDDGHGNMSFHQRHYQLIQEAEVKEDGYDIHTIQELLGHKDVSTTMIPIHVLQ